MIIRLYLPGNVEKWLLEMAESGMITGGPVTGILAFGLHRATKVKKGKSNEKRDDISDSYVDDFSLFLVYITCGRTGI